MTHRPECKIEENILRAITEAHWDEQYQRCSSSLFKGEFTSVSRLEILPHSKLVEIFRRDLEKGNSKLLKTGKINVGKLIQISQQFGRLNNSPTIITVEQDPLEENPAHAEIPQKLTKGLSKAINKSLEIKSV